MTMKLLGFCAVLCFLSQIDAAVIRSRRQAFTAVQDKSLNPLTNAVGYDPKLLNSGLLAPAVGGSPFQSAGQFQGPAAANVQTNSGTEVAGSLNIDGLNLWDGDIFRSTNAGNYGTGGGTDSTSIDVLGAALANIGTGTSLGDGLLPSGQTALNVPALTPGGTTVGTGSTTGIGTGPGGLGVGQSTGANVLGADVFGQRSGTNIGQGGFSTGNQINAAGVGVNSGTSFGNNEQGDFQVKEGSSGGFGGADLYNVGTTTTLKNNIPGLTGPAGIPNPYDPYGKFKGGYGIGLNEGGTAVGTGYQVPQYYGFDWPNEGVRVEKNTVIPVLGSNIAEHSQANLNVRPKDSLAQYEFSDYTGFTTLGTGYRDGWAGEGGINGYKFNDRFVVPVLGTKVVDVQDKSGFDLAKFRFDKGVDGQYGPVRVVSDASSFSMPWAGQLIQNAMWGAALEDAGYAPDSKSLLPPGLIPGVPIVG